MPTAADIERRLAAIFAVDLEGYSRLMGADEAGTLRGLTERRELLDKLIASHRGRIANTAGDSVLAEFASIVDAVQCAVTAQAALGEANRLASPDRQMNFRIGLHVGDVMIKGGDLFGDGVNIAARLQTLASPGSVYISGAAYDQVRRILPFKFADLGTMRAKNIEEPIRVFEVTATGAVAAPRIPFQRRPRPRTTDLLAVFAVLSLAAVGWYVAIRERHASELPRLSLVVLPFGNLNADPAQDYLGDIITDELTAALSRLRGATVIAASSARTLKGNPVDIKQLGAELGVRYALEGNVLRSEGSVRINAKLVDAQTAETLWSDRFDVNRADILRTQDEIVTRLASALHGELVQMGSQRSTTTAASNLDAEDLAMRCEAAAYRLGGEAATPGYQLCERALSIDPRNVRALVQLAFYRSSRVSRVQSSDAEADLKQADALVTRALEIDPGYYMAHCVKATILEGQHRVPDGIAAAERCLALNPTYAGAYRALSLLHFFLAHSGKALEYADRGIRLSPRDPQTSTFLLIKGWAYFMMKQDDEALEWLRRAATASPQTPIILAALTSELALTGHDTEARATLAQYLALESTRTRTLAMGLRPGRQPGVS